MSRSLQNGNDLMISKFTEVADRRHFAERAMTGLSLRLGICLGRLALTTMPWPLQSPRQSEIHLHFLETSWWHGANLVS